MSYPDNQILKHSNKSQIKVICDFCNSLFLLTYKSAEKNRKKNSKHKCSACTGIPSKPQNKAEYWTESLRKRHSDSLKSSESHKNGIKNRDQYGEKNGMFGKKITEESRKKMSISRTGKIGSQATAWKGGRCSVTSRVKGVIHGRYDWYGKVYKRDGWKCVECGSNKKIDAHHIDPVNQIIKRLCKTKTFVNDDEKVAWLVEQPELIDLELKNGKTLCRICHKKKHANWGSHDCK